MHAGSLTQIQGHGGKCAAVALKWMCVWLGSVMIKLLFSQSNNVKTKGVKSNNA